MKFAKERGRENIKKSDLHREFFIRSTDLLFKVTYSNTRNIIHGKDDQKNNYRQKQPENCTVNIMQLILLFPEICEM